MTWLKRGTVKLLPYQEEWAENAKNTITLLRNILGDTAIDIQHIGSTAVPHIHAKPIIDIAVGIRKPDDIIPYRETLEKNNFVFRGEDIPGQLLLVVGDFENDIRTHHIHVVMWEKSEWNNYICFRDYLNAFPEKAMLYDECKLKLAMRFPYDRKSYTSGKNELISIFLKEAIQNSTF